MADTLKVIAENTSNINGGKVINMRYDDILAPPETRTQEEIVNNLKRKLKNGCNDPRSEVNPR